MYHPSITDVKTIIEKLNKHYKINATIINQGQLEFVLEKPQMQMFGHEQYPKLYQKAAVLMEGLTKAHALCDGNKRCAMMVAEFMIKVNEAELVLPLKAIRMSVDAAMDDKDEMTEEIQQWFKIHIANNTDQLSILLQEHVEEESIIKNLLDQKRSREAEDLVGKWLAFNSYPEHKTGWDQLMKKWKSHDPTRRRDNQAREFAIWLKNIRQYGSEHHPHHISVNISNIADLTMVDHTLEELVHYEQKIQRAEKLLANTNDVQLLLSQAYVLEQFGRATEALGYQERILKIDPTQHHAYYHIGLLYAHLEDYQKSVENFKKCLELNPGDPSVHYQIAVGLSNLGRNDDALKEIIKSIKIEPKESEFYYAKSIMQAGLGDFNNAEKSLEYALKIKPNNPKYIALLGRILSEVGEHNEAIDVLQTVINMEPESIVYACYMAHVYAAMENYDEAIKHYDKVLQREPDNLETLINIGGAYSNCGEYKRALQYLKKGLTIESKHKKGLDSMGITLRKIGEYDEAIKYLDQSIELDREDMRPVFNKSIVLVKQNKFDDALELIKEIIKRRPDTKKVIRNESEFAKIRNFELFKKLME